jgi:DNA-binding transcriptional LysR family regulator
MNLTYVLAFHRVAAAGSFTRAARMSGVSQPTLSAQVRSLERIVGVSLFHREGRQIRLTPIHVIPVLTELKRSTPGFKFSIRIDNSQGVTSHVLNNESDVGVMARPVSDPRLVSAKIREDRLVLLVGRRDPWFDRKRVQLADLAGRDLVVREKGSITREVMDRCLAQSSVEPGQVFDVGTREAVKEAVAAGFGVGVVFASEAGGDSRIHALSILGAELSVDEYAICRAERRRIALIARFFDVARKLAESNGWLGPVPVAAG